MSFLNRLFIKFDHHLMGGRFKAQQDHRRFELQREDSVGRSFPFGLAIEYGKRSSLLNRLCDLYGSDKGEVTSENNPYPWPSHNYADVYEMLFQLRRHNVKSVVECGIGTTDPTISSSMGDKGLPGASLRIWRDYFPNAQIIGIDIDDRILFQEDSIKTYQCDQTSQSSIKQFINEAGLEPRSVDIIIDDGLHVFSAGVSLFEALSGCLADDGVYVIEDVEAEDYLRYAQYFEKLDTEFSVRFIHLERPGLAIGNNRMVVISRCDQPMS